eukprot:15087348-Alexandrium_andersonii.AAC.1
MSLRCWTCGGRWPSACGVQTVQESPPAYEPQSNGSVENAVRQLKGLIRILMLALQERIKGE